MALPRITVIDGVGIGLAIGFAGALAFGAMADKPTRPTPTPAQERPAGALAEPTPGDPADPRRRTPMVIAIEQNAPAVVSINTEVMAQDPFAAVLGRAGSTTAGQGSGVVIEPSGIVLTNAHVVFRATHITASFSDGQSFEADVIGLAKDLDLAVLRLRGANDLETATIGTSADLMLGEPVIAIGNPFGLGQTVTTGVISATQRTLETDDRVYQDFIQTDASINPGNSGGPLLDATGRLIGITTAIRSDAEGIGFAIPVDRAIKVARDLTAFGSVQIAWLGVDLEDVTKGTRQKRVPAARVARVYPGSAAAAAGVSGGDLIVGIDGRPMQGRADLNTYLASVEVGSMVTLDILREDTPSQLQVATARLPSDAADSTLDAVLGVTLSDSTPRWRGRALQGVQIAAARPRGAWARSGLNAGDVLVAINGTVVGTPDALRGALAQEKSAHRPSALFTIQRGDAQGRITLPL